MSDRTKWQKLHSEWMSAKAADDEAQKAIDDQMQLYLQGKSDPPSRKMMNMVDDLCHQRHEARGALDQFIHDHAS